MKQTILNKLIPQPMQLTVQDGMHRYNANSVFIIATDLPDAKDITGKLLKQYFQILPELQQTAADPDVAGEDCKLIISETEIRIAAASADGLRNALKTLRQLAEAHHDCNTVFPCVTITDSPAMTFRGIHLCAFPEVSLTELEKNIRLAAYHKFNYAVIEFWGTFPFQSHPELSWQDKQYDRAELQRIVEQAKDWGITLIPQFNILGHATNSRAISGKFATLYSNPELEHLFDPSGWCWCLSNPVTRQVLTDVVLELHDFFRNPPYFHIGCDEAEDVASCLYCKQKNFKDLFADHINWFHTLLTERNCRLIMWHDMLVRRDDPRWTGFVASGKHLELDGFYQELPNDILIADWQYGIAPPDKRAAGWPVSDFFRSKGFETVMCPWDSEPDMESMAAYTQQVGNRGMLITTWHYLYGLKYTSFMLCAPYALWNPANNPGISLSGRLTLGKHMLQICHDMGLTRYEDCGYTAYQIAPERYPEPIH